MIKRQSRALCPTRCTRTRVVVVVVRASTLGVELGGKPIGASIDRRRPLAGSGSERKSTHAHAHTQTRDLVTSPRHTHTRAHTHAHTHAHARTRTHAPHARTRRNDRRRTTRRAVRRRGVADWITARRRTTGKCGVYAHRLGGPLPLRTLSQRSCKAAAPKGPAFCFFLKLSTSRLMRTRSVHY